MNQATENAITAEAKRCSDAIQAAMKKRPKPKFVSVIGRLNGRYGVES